MLLIFQAIKKFFPLVIWLFLWLVGIFILYPLWRFEENYPSLFLYLVSLCFLGLVGWFLFSFFKGKNAREFFNFIISLLRIIAVLFFLTLAFVAFSVSLWWKGSMAVLFCFLLVYVKIPNGVRRI